MTTTDEREDLTRRIDELCAENERLRKAKDTMRGDAFEIGAMLVKVRDENAKLRELVVEVFKCARRGAACETCKVNNDGYACVYIIRELGIEVSA